MDNSNPHNHHNNNNNGPPTSPVRKSYSDNLENRVHKEIMRKASIVSPRKGRRPVVAESSSHSFDESQGGVVSSSLNYSSSHSTTTSNNGGGSAISSLTGGGGGGRKTTSPQRIHELLDANATPLPSPSLSSVSSKVSKEELKSLKMMHHHAPQRRLSTGNFGKMGGAYSPLDMYGASNHSSRSIASDSTGSASADGSSSNMIMMESNHSRTTGSSSNNTPSMKAIRRGSMSKEEAQKKLQDDLSRVQDYDEASDCESTPSRQALKDRFATKKNLKNKKRASRRSSISSISSTGSNLSINHELNAVSAHSLNSIVSLSNISLDLGEATTGSPGRKNAPEYAVSFSHGNGHNNTNTNASSSLPIRNIIERTHSAPLAGYNTSELQRRKEQKKTDQIIESLVWFSFHVPRTVLEDLISYEIEVWKSHQTQQQQQQQQNAAIAALAVSSHHSQQRQKARRERRAARAAAAGLTANSSNSRHSSNNNNDASSSCNTFPASNMDDDDKKAKATTTATSKLGSSSHSHESIHDFYGYGQYDASDDDDDEGDGEANNTSDDGSFSSLSDDGNGGNSGKDSNENNFDANFTETMMRLQGESLKNQHIVANKQQLPRAVQRECALLFVDMSGFTKLSTMLDVESLSKVINSYFDMIVSEVISFGGDILKFAGDAFFAEWKVPPEEEKDDEDNHHHEGRFGGGAGGGRRGVGGALSDLNASLVSTNEMDWDFDDDIPKLSSCVLAAAKCAVSIVEKFSDYHVTSASGTTSDAMLNVHCGIGVGHVVGLHVGDYKEDQEEEGVELRREFLILGDAIEQVSKAADVATDGQVMASAEAMMALSVCCDMLYSVNPAKRPVCIASRHHNFLNLDPSYETGGTGMGGVGGVDGGAAMQPYESLRMHCSSLNHAALARLHLQMALYVHPVIRSDELALSAAIQAGRISQPTETVETRHRAEAELRSVFTIFIKAVMTPRITGVEEVDQELYKQLADIMHVTSRELDRYSGHLRQFIVDDKGVVLIATFGLRGSTFPNMVSNNGLPAVFAIHRSLKTELKVENRIGATFGKVYCGVVGGVRRHEFAVMGAPVNLAARLMGSKVNNGILVDEAVRAQSDARFTFKSLPPVQAKGYDKPVPILEPENASGATKKKRSTFPFTGRKEEKNAVISAANILLEDPVKNPSTMIFLMGESGMGKTALAVSVLEDIKKKGTTTDKAIVTARSTSTETEQRIPLSSYRKIFMSIIRDVCEHDGTLDNDMSMSSSGSKEESTKGDGVGTSLQAFQKSRRRRSTGMPEPGDEGHDRPGMSRSKAEWELVKDPGGSAHSMATLSQSLQGISADLADLSGHQASISHSKDGSVRYPLSASIHGDFATPQLKTRRKASELGNSLHRLTLGRSTKAPSSTIKAHSMHRGSRSMRSKHSVYQDDQSTNSADTNKSQSIPYFEKLCWVCEKLNYPYEYADIVGSQFLGFDKASPVTHVDGHVPTMDELVEFLALAFICCADFADLTVLFIDDFQWVDSFSWKIFRVLCKRGKKLLILCAMRSHDKQALRRLSAAATRQSELQSQMIEISLVPLDFANIRSLMALVLKYDKKSIPESLCTDIFQRTGGLPVYVVQLLETIKRKGTVEVGENGMLRWNAAGLKDKRAAATNKTGAVMEETFLSRFDGLDVRVRKVLQTCAVLGLSFAMSDVIQVHPELEEIDIENAIDSAVDEMILVEQVEDDDDESCDDLSTKSGSTRESGEYDDNTMDRSTTVDGMKGDRYFQFSHAMWRKNVLATMLKERKIELHRSIAEGMERSKVLILEESDISRLLTLFDHWKSCGDFCKSAPLALTVGSRLEEWDLCAQSLELYEDALEMAFECVNTTEDVNEEWVQVSAKPAVLDLILRLHVRVGMCHQRLGDDYESIVTFEDAYKIMKTASKIPGTSKQLMMPIISSLCVLRMAQERSSPKSKIRQEKLLAKFVQEALAHRSPVHIGRSLSMQAMFYAKSGNLERGVEIIDELRKVYNVEANSSEMVAEYGRDFVIECLAESVQWYYLLELHTKAERKADTIIEKLLPLVDPMDTDACMNVVLPVIQVLRLVGRAKDADWLLKRYIINPAHEHAAHSQFWVPFFNPLAYVIEIMMMEESEKYNPQVLKEMETWVLNEDNSEYDIDLERKAHAIMGEMCWRLANFHEDDDDIVREQLLRKAKSLLMPVARYPHDEIFLKHTAQALMEAF